jgi:hypothetical protein
MELFTNRRNLLIGGGILLILIIAVSVALFSSSQSKNSIDKSGRYVDTRSGEVVSDPAGKAPDQYGAAPNQPIYLGFSELSSIGLSKYQLETLKSTLYEFSKGITGGIKEYSITVASIKTSPADQSSDDPSTTTTFDLTTNRTTTYNATIKYSGVSTLRLLLTKDNKPVFDSATLDQGVSN